MSLFFNYSSFYKPGKGVEKDEPQKTGVAQFFELYKRKFWKLMGVNIIYFLMLLPVILFIYAFIYDNTYDIFTSYGITSDQIWTPILGLAMLYDKYIPSVAQNILLAVSLLLYGPMKTGITYVYRNFAQENHSWLTDILDKGKENIKQALFFGILDVLVIIVFCFNLYTVATDVGGAGVYQISGYASVFFLIIYSFMRKYFYLMIVTVKLGNVAIIKNSALLAFLGIFRNVWSSIISLTIWLLFVVLIIGVHPLIEVVLFPFFIFSFTGFSNVFNCYPVVKRFLVDPQSAEQTEK